MRGLIPVLLLLILLVAGVGYWLGYDPAAAPATDGAMPETAEMDEPELGPVDGDDLAPTDIERVALGTEAPDFNLLAYSGDVLSLSDYRGRRDVVLVFYRGHW